MTHQFQQQQSSTDSPRSYGTWTNPPQVPGMESGSQCPLCPMIFPESGLKAHITRCHPDSLPFVCTICSKRYISASGLRHHMTSHRGKRFMCPVCDTKFIHKFDIKKHLKSQHDSAQCVTCGGVFRLGNEYNSHVPYCNGNVTQGNYKKDSFPL